MTTNYTASFYEGLCDGVTRSAGVIVPIALELTRARSVIDVGCGSGHWLNAFRAHGTEDVFGIDGTWVRPSSLAADQFAPADLSQPLTVDRTFDLAVCLEVAEHLPDSSGDILVSSLVRLAPVLMFSAAIPEQGGVDHVNEQWPEYWAARFAAHGYVAADAIRPRVWSNADVESWYAQNTLVYVDQRCLANYPALECAAASTNPSQLSVVHPRHYLSRIRAAESIYLHPDPRRFSLSTLIGVAPAVVTNAVRGRLRSRQD